MATQISDWRAAIDVLDGQLLQLLNIRAKLACELAKVKRETGVEIIDLEREQQVLARVRQGNEGPLDHEAVTRIYQSIMDEARRLEERVG
jgi:chorismate mutase / prephenate dehydratase